MRVPVHGLLSLLLTSTYCSKRTYKCTISLLLCTRSKFVSRPLSVAALHELTTDFATSAENLPSEFHHGFSNYRPQSRLLRRAKLRNKKDYFENKKRLTKYSSLLHDSAAKGSLNEGRLIHGHVIKCGLKIDSHLWVSLINAYAKCGSLVYAHRLLNVMPERDVVSWTALITGFVAQGYGSEGASLFCEMRKEGMRPNDFALATALKACSISFDVDFGKQVHVEAIKLGLCFDLFVGSALVDLYAKCGKIELAERVFCSMPQLNVVSWNALLNGYAEIGDGQKVTNLFSSMEDMEMKFSKFTLSTVLKGCTNSGYIRAGQVVHAMAITLGCALDKFLSSTLVDMYSKCGLADKALKVFNRIKDPDVVDWGAIITCLDQQGCCQEAAELFNLMRMAGVRPNQFTFASLIRGTTGIGDQRSGESIHACIYKYGFESDNLVGNALITMYMQNGRVLDGTRVFEAIIDLDSISWNALLSGFQDHETCKHGPRIFYQMLLKGFKPDMCTFIGILKSCSSLSDVGFGKQLHAHIIKHNLGGNDFVGTALVDMYAKGGCLEDADFALNRLINRDLFTWTAIITGYAQSDQADIALMYFSKMQLDGLKPNEFTLTSCLVGCSHLAILEIGRLLHSMAVKAGLSCDMFVSAALVDMYAKCGCIEDAETVFEGLVLRDTVSWNTMIGGYVEHRQGEKALEAFSMMLDEGTAPDAITFTIILSACSYMGLTEEGNKLFSLMSKAYGITPTVEHYACIFDMLGRAGKFAEIKSLITKMNLSHDALILETLLGVCGLHGNVELGERAAEKLLELEPKMESNYILLSNILAIQGRWDDFRKVRALMTSLGIKKKPGCSWIEINGQVHIFKNQDGSHPKIKEIYLTLDQLVEKLTSIVCMPIIF